MRSLAVLILALALSAPAHAAPKDRLKSSPDLWATVNVCDTPADSNRIGLRGSMPGLGKRASLYMRFQVHYFARSDQKWHNIASGADSGWMKLGIASKRVLEGGHTFTFTPPPNGGLHRLRGAVSFQWRVKGKIVRRLRELTEAGHKSTFGADPPGFSAAECVIS